MGKVFGQGIGVQTTRVDMLHWRERGQIAIQVLVDTLKSPGFN